MRITKTTPFHSARYLGKNASDLGSRGILSPVQFTNQVNQNVFGSLGRNQPSQLIVKDRQSRQISVFDDSVGKCGGQRLA